MNYEFFKTVKIIDTGRTRKPSSKNPTGLKVRLFKDGSIYPSKELMEACNLQFKNRTEEHPGYAFDIIDTALWEPMKNFPRIIMFGLTSKSSPKVDLFGSTKFNDDNSPKADVLTQGAKDKNLLNLVNSLNWFNENEKYIDLLVVMEHPLTTADGIAYIPKVISRGDDVGKLTYVRREHSTFYPVELAPAEPVILNQDSLDVRVTAEVAEVSIEQLVDTHPL